MPNPSELPYRPNVGGMIFNKEGHVFIARRNDMPGVGGPLTEGIWQCPQGGIDEGEDPRAAVLREVKEETGLSQLTILGEYPDWLTYDLPPHLIGKALGGKFKGQKQKWFALGFSGRNHEVNLTVTGQHPEFDTWQWLPLSELPNKNLGFKREIYLTLITAFSPYARSFSILH
ncbi:RNA pyrophosphohydrolase [Entomobacter blattae]|uniref:RNA pyrophosphohydrolase n=1 Tax=Entomobacter blattae TaxID=2762277 RepID=A0A7H1NNC0_9PROT|nr:RNA pyrophosphohydrolase [Entomobacter blattae]QNT77280.1 RNA pyrophosphohydrolase [Entomobacter blattae]